MTEHGLQRKAVFIEGVWYYPVDDVHTRIVTVKLEMEDHFADKEKEAYDDGYQEGYEAGCDR